MTPDPLPARVSVVLPVHDEEGSLEALAGELDAVATRFATFEVVAVDDGSSDRSGAVLDDLAAAYPWLRVVRLPGNRGQTVAVAEGVRRCGGDVVVLMDSDGQNDPGDIPALVAHKLATGADIVAGYRRDRQEPVHRRMLSAAGNRLCAEVSGVVIRDSGCSLKAFSADVLRTLRLRTDDHRFLPAWAAYRGARIVELEVNDRPRTAGRSHYGLGRVPRVLIDLFGMWVTYRFRDRPLRSAVWAGSWLAALWGAAAGALVLSGQIGLAVLAGAAALTLLLGALLVGAIAESQLRDRSYHDLRRTVDAAMGPPPVAQAVAAGARW